MKLNVYIFSVLSVLFLGTVHAQVANSFSKEAADAVLKKISSIDIAKATPLEIITAVSITRALGNGPEITCAQITKPCIKVEEPQGVYNCAIALSTLGCKLSEKSAKSAAGKLAQEVLTNAVEEKDLHKLQQSLVPGIVLGSASKELLESAISSLSSLFNPKVGGFQKSPTDIVSHDDTWRALEILAYLQASKLGENPTLKKLVKSVLNAFPIALDDIDTTGEGILSFGEGNALKSTSKTIQYVQQIAKQAKIKLDLDDSMVSRFAGFAVSGIESELENLESISDVVSFLSTLDDDVVSILLDNKSIPSDAANELSLSVVGLLGGKPNSSLEFKSATIDGKKATITAKGNKATVKLVGNNSLPGIHKLNVQVVKDTVESSVDFVYSVVTSINMQNVRVAVTDTTSVKGGKEYTATHPKKISQKVGTESNQFLHVSFGLTSASGETVNPRQAVVSFKNVATSETVTMSTKYRSGEYLLSISLANGDPFNYIDGEYDVSVYVADASIKNPVSWNVATVALKFGAPAAKEHLPLYTVHLLHESDTSTGPLKEIHHQFREPEKRPPAIVSLAFSGTVVALLCVFIISVPLVGGNLSAFSFNPMNLLFIGTLGAILALFTFFWFKLSLFSTLNALAPLALLLVISGRSALANRQKQMKLQAAKATKSE